MEKDLVCIACPIGCRVTITKDDASPDGYIVEGNTCKKGRAYAIKEVTAPSRMLTSTVRIEGAKLCRLPVVSSDEVPKQLLFKAMEEMNGVLITSPVIIGDIVLENIAGSGVDLVASRSM